MAIKHLPAEPIEGVQRCERCRAVLVDYSPAVAVMTPTRSAGDARALFFAPGRPLVHEHGSGGSVMTSAVDVDGVDVWPEVPDCRVPDVEGVNVIQ